MGSAMVEGGVVLGAAKVRRGEKFRQDDHVRAGLGRVGDATGGLVQGGGDARFRGHLDEADGKRVGHADSLAEDAARPPAPGWHDTGEPDKGQSSRA